MGLTDLNALVVGGSGNSANSGSGRRGLPTSATLPPVSDICRSSDFERRLLPVLLETLKDANGEVQNVSVKTVTNVVFRVSDSNSTRILDWLFSLLADKEDRIRDIAALTIKAIVTEYFLYPTTHSIDIVEQIAARLIRLSPTGLAYDTLCEILDIYEEILGSLKLNISSIIADIESFLTPLLRHDRPAVRKKASGGLVALASHVEVDRLQAMAGELVGQIELNEVSHFTRTLIGYFGGIASANGVKIQIHYARMLSVLTLLNYSGDDELMEASLHTIESMVRGNSTALKDSISDITTFACYMLKHDPNFVQDDDEDAGDDGDLDMNEDDGDDDDFAEDDEMDHEFTDDDDLSWKVRKASARLLCAVVGAYPREQGHLMRTIGPALVKRFTEREDNVKIDVLTAYSMLLHEISSSCGLTPLETTPKVLALSTASGNAKRIRIQDLEEMEVDSAVEVLKPQLKTVSKLLFKSLSSKTKSASVRQLLYTILRQCVSLAPAVMGPFVGDFLVLSASVITEFSSDLGHVPAKLDIIEFISTVVQLVPKTDIAQHLELIGNTINTVLEDPHHKVVVGGLETVTGIVHSATGPSKELEQSEVVLYEEFFEVCQRILSKSDVDYDVRSTALQTIGSLWSSIGEYLLRDSKLTEDFYSSMLSRVQNETTRMVAVETLVRVMASVENDSVRDLSPMMPQLFDELSEFLKKDNRDLRVVALQLLLSVSKRYLRRATTEGVTAAMTNLATLISDVDVQILALATEVVTSIYGSSDVALESVVTEKILPSYVALVDSPSITEVAPVMSHLLRFFALTAEKSPHAVSSLIEQLLKPIQSVGAADSLLSLKTRNNMFTEVCLQVRADVIASIVRSSSGNPASTDLVAKFIGNLNSPKKVPEPSLYVSLATLGLLGKNRSSADVAKLLESSKCFDSILTFLSESIVVSEEIRTAATFAVGSYIVGDLGQHLSVILNGIASSMSMKKQYYLHLRSLNVCIGGCLAMSTPERQEVKPLVAEIWKTLFTESEPLSPMDQDKTEHQDMEQGSRAAVSECMGRMILFDCASFLPELGPALKSGSTHKRIQAIAAINYILPQTSNKNADPSLDALLSPIVQDIIDTAEREQEVEICHAALKVINTLFRNRIDLVVESVPKMAAVAHDNIALREDLITEVDMGPFKHRVDNGLGKRKTAYECIFTIIGNQQLMQRVDMGLLLQSIVTSANDPAIEIQTLSHLMLVKFSKLFEPSAASAAVSASTQNLAGGQPKTILLTHAAPRSTPETLKSLVNETNAAEPLSKGLRKTLFTKSKDTAVKQEIENQQELAVGAARALTSFMTALRLAEVGKTENPTDSKKNANSNSVLPAGEQYLQPIVQLWVDVQADPRLSSLISAE